MSTINIDTYYDEQRSLTREYLWPQFLLDLWDEKLDSYLVKRRKIARLDPVIAAAISIIRRHMITFVDTQTSVAGRD